VHELIQKHLSAQCRDALDILHLLPYRLRRELRGVREKTAEDGDVDRILYAAEVEAAEGGECRVSLPVDRLLLFDDDLHQ